MSALTAALYGALVVYLGGWFLNFWTGNFSVLLFTLTVVSLGYWLAERFHFKPQREAAARTLEQQDAARRADLARQGIELSPVLDPQALVLRTDVHGTDAFYAVRWLRPA